MKKMLLLILLCFMFMNFSDHKIIYSKHKEKTIDTSFLHSDINDSVLYLALCYYNVKYPEKVLAQAKLESGNYTSTYFKERNNFLGLYNSESKEMYRFDTWADCIKGYQEMVECKIKDDENYYTFLKRIGYAEDKHYIKKIKEIEKSL